MREQLYKMDTLVNKQVKESDIMKENKTM